MLHHHCQDWYYLVRIMQPETQRQNTGHLPEKNSRPTTSKKYHYSGPCNLKHIGKNSGHLPEKTASLPLVKGIRTMQPETQLRQNSGHLEKRASLPLVSQPRNMKHRLTLVTEAKL